MRLLQVEAPWKSLRKLVTVPYDELFRAVLLIVGALLGQPIGVAHAQSSPTPMQKEYLKKLEGPIILRGDYLKAILSAYSYFGSELSKNERAAAAPDTPNKELAAWLSKIEDYDIHVSQTRDAIVVDFTPTVRGNFMPVLGGGAHYEIDKTSFEIRSRVFSK